MSAETPEKPFFVVNIAYSEVVTEMRRQGVSTVMLDPTVVMLAEYGMTSMQDEMINRTIATTQGSMQDFKTVDDVIGCQQGADSESIMAMHVAEAVKSHRERFVTQRNRKLTAAGAIAGLGLAFIVFAKADGADFGPGSAELPAGTYQTRTLELHNDSSVMQGEEGKQVFLMSLATVIPGIPDFKIRTTTARQPVPSLSTPATTTTPTPSISRISAAPRFALEAAPTSTVSEDYILPGEVILAGSLLLGVLAAHLIGRTFYENDVAIARKACKKATQAGYRLKQTQLPKIT